MVNNRNIRIKHKNITIKVHDDDHTYFHAYVHLRFKHGVLDTYFKLFRISILDYEFVDCVTLLVVR